MAGIDRFTGRELGGWLHVLQSIDVIFETRLGERVMLRHFGGGLQAVLGRRITPAILARATAVFALALTLWEPRVRVVRVSVAGSVEEIRAGALAFVLDVAYRPRGHLGDPTEEAALRRIGVGAGTGGAFGLREVVA